MRILFCQTARICSAVSPATATAALPQYDTRGHTRYSVHSLHSSHHRGHPFTNCSLACFEADYAICNVIIIILSPVSHASMVLLCHV